jgi:hypothetical protein
MSKLAVYFSQSWRPRDVDLNLRIWNEFIPACELLVDEPEDSSAEPPYYINRIEELLRRADLFLAVLTYRSRDSGLRCSPYMLFEIRLAERGDMPRLILYERKTGFRPPQNLRPWERYVPFDRAETESLMDDSAWEKTIQPGIRSWMEWCVQHRLPAGYEQSTSAVLLLDGAFDRAAVEAVRPSLEQHYDRVLEADPARQVSDAAIRTLREAGLVMAFDLNSSLYAAAHMSGLPAIRMLHSSVKDPLPWIVRSGPGGSQGGYEEDIVHWDVAENLPAQVEPRIRSMFRLSLIKRDGKDTSYLKSKRYRGFEIFVSHNLKPPDDLLVRRICEIMRDHDVSAFEYSDRNRAGIDWRAAMDQALSKTTHFVALVSPTYDQSPTCTQELEAALARGPLVEILPFKVLGRQIPHPRLVGIHNEPLISPDPAVNAAEVAQNILERLDAALKTR